VVRMSKGRVEAFSDGVLAIIITIMVLQLTTPKGDGLMALRPIASVVRTYLLSYIYIGIYWNNHHHLLQAAPHIAGWILWANLNWLLWFSLTPLQLSGWGRIRWLPGRWRCVRKSPSSWAASNCHQVVDDDSDRKPCD
jgi:uncharacterized membrane protein